MLDIAKFADSKSFFEYDPHLCTREEGSFWKERLTYFFAFLRKIAVLPFALCYKVFLTALRLVGLGISFSFVLITLGFSLSARTRFLEKMERFGVELADWLLLPFAILTCLLKLALARNVYPRIYC